MSYLRYPQPTAGVWDTIKEIGSKVGGGVLDFYGQAKKTEGAAETSAAQAAALQQALLLQQQQKAAQGGLPGWVLPVGIAAAGVGAVVLITRRKK